MDKKTIKRLLTYCKPYRFLIMLLTLLSIVSVVFTLLTPVLIGQAIDLLVGKNQVHFQALLNKLIFIGIVILIISLIQWIMGQVTNTITYNITNDLRNRVFDQIQVLPLKYIDATSHGDILGRLINDIDLIGQGLLQSFYILAYRNCNNCRNDFDYGLYSFFGSCNCGCFNTTFFTCRFFDC